MPPSNGDTFRSTPSLRDLYEVADAAGFAVHGADLCLILPKLQRHGSVVALRAWRYFCERGAIFCAPEQPTAVHFARQFNQWVERSAPANITQAWG